MPIARSLLTTDAEEATALLQRRLGAELMAQQPYENATLLLIRNSSNQTVLVVQDTSAPVRAAAEAALLEYSTTVDQNLNHSVPVTLYASVKCAHPLPFLLPLLYPPSRSAPLEYHSTSCVQLSARTHP